MWWEVRARARVRVNTADLALNVVGDASNTLLCLLEASNKTIARLAEVHVGSGSSLRWWWRRVEEQGLNRRYAD